MNDFRRRKVVSRRRTVHTCEPCRRRKIKCDQERPRCGQCQAGSRHCDYIETQTQHGSLEAEEQNEISSMDTSPTDQNGLVLLDGARHQYVSRSSWLPNVSAMTSSHTPSLEMITPTASGPARMPEWLSSIPRQELVKLANWFSEHCLLFVPVITVSELEALLSTCLKNDSEVDNDDFILFAATCYVATISIESWSSSVNLVRSPDQWKNAMEDLLSERRGPPSLQYIKGLILLATSSIREQGQELYNPSLCPIATLVRNAQVCGLHHEPSTISGMNPQRYEERRRLFWIIFELDLSFSLAYGLPTLIARTGYNVNEIKVDTRSEPGVKFLGYKLHADHVFSRVLDEVYGVKKPSLSILHDLSDAASKYQQEVNALAGFEGVSGKFTALVLQMVAARVSFVLHQDYLRGKGLAMSRERALSASTAFIQGYISCITDFTFAPLRWIINLYNVFHPCAILLQDLILYPNSNEASQSWSTLGPCFSQLSDLTDRKWQLLERLRVQARAASDAQMDGGDGSFDTKSGIDVLDWNSFFEPPFTTLVFD